MRAFSAALPLPPMGMEFIELLRFYAAAQKLKMAALLSIPRDMAYLFSSVIRDAEQLNALFELAETYNDKVLKGVCLFGLMPFDDPQILAYPFFHSLSESLQAFYKEFLELQKRDRELSPLLDFKLPFILYHHDRIEVSCYFLDRQSADFFQEIGTTSIAARRFESEEEAVALLQRFSSVHIKDQLEGMDPWQLALKLIAGDQVKTLSIDFYLTDTPQLVEALKVNRSLERLNFYGFLSRLEYARYEEETKAQMALLAEAFKTNVTLRFLNAHLSENVKLALSTLRQQLAGRLQLD